MMYCGIEADIANGMHGFETVVIRNKENKSEMHKWS